MNASLCGFGERVDLSETRRMAAEPLIELLTPAEIVFLRLGIQLVALRPVDSEAHLDLQQVLVLVLTNGDDGGVVP